MGSRARMSEWMALQQALQQAGAVVVGMPAKGGVQ